MAKAKAKAKTTKEKEQELKELREKVKHQIASGKSGGSKAVQH